jgi:hypothetical protein
VIIIRDHTEIIEKAGRNCFWEISNDYKDNDFYVFLFRFSGGFSDFSKENIPT